MNTTKRRVHQSKKWYKINLGTLLYDSQCITMLKTEKKNGLVMKGVL